MKQHIIFILAVIMLIMLIVGAMFNLFTLHRTFGQWYSTATLLVMLASVLVSIYSLVKEGK
jgi:hypothetical protein